MSAITYESSKYQSTPATLDAEYRMTTNKTIDYYSLLLGYFSDGFKQIT